MSSNVRIISKIYCDVGASSVRFSTSDYHLTSRGGWVGKSFAAL